MDNSLDRYCAKALVTCMHTRLQSSTSETRAGRTEHLSIPSDPHAPMPVRNAMQRQGPMFDALEEQFVIISKPMTNRSECLKLYASVPHRRWAEIPNDRDRNKRGKARRFAYHADTPTRRFADTFRPVRQMPPLLSS